MHRRYTIDIVEHEGTVVAAVRRGNDGVPLVGRFSVSISGVESERVRLGFPASPLPGDLWETAVFWAVEVVRGWRQANVRSTLGKAEQVIKEARQLSAELKSRGIGA